MAYTDRNIVWGDPKDLFKKSAEDGVYIMPWKLLHEGYDVTRQEGVVSVSPDAGIPITHSRFSQTGRIISARIFTDNEPVWWWWFSRATLNRALPCWVYDCKVNGFMKCYITEQPNWAPAGTSVHGGYVSLKLYTVSQTIPIRKFITENTPERMVVEGASSALIYQEDEVQY